MRFTRFLPILILAVGAAPILRGQASAPPAAPSVPAANPANPLLAQGMDALRAGQPGPALAQFQQVLAADPNNAVANLLAASAALELYQGADAVRYAEKARQLDPQSWKIHTTLVAAYAAAGMKQQRDEERTLLRQMHASGPPDARQATGFLVEMFPSGPNRVDAVEEFTPTGKFHTYYRFIVHQPDGKRLEEIDVQSNDFDQKSWAIAHFGEAGAGERQFQITGHTDAGDHDYRMVSGKPDYDTFRAMIVQILASRPPV